MMKRCNCKICTRTNRFISIIKDLPQEDRKFITEILDDLICAEEHISNLEFKSNYANARDAQKDGRP